MNKMIRNLMLVLSLGFVAQAQPMNFLKNIMGYSQAPNYSIYRNFLGSVYCEFFKTGEEITSVKLLENGNTTTITDTVQVKSLLLFCQDLFTKNALKKQSVTVDVENDMVIFTDKDLIEIFSNGISEFKNVFSNNKNNKKNKQILKLEGIKFNKNQDSNRIEIENKNEKTTTNSSSFLSFFGFGNENKNQPERKKIKIGAVKNFNKIENLDLLNKKQEKDNEDFEIVEMSTVNNEELEELKIEKSKKSFRIGELLDNGTMDKEDALEKIKKNNEQIEQLQDAKFEAEDEELKNQIEEKIQNLLNENFVLQNKISELMK